MAIKVAQHRVSEHREIVSAPESRNNISDYESLVQPGKKAKVLYMAKDSFAMASNTKSLKAIENGGTASKADARTPPYFRNS